LIAEETVDNDVLSEHMNLSKTGKQMNKDFFERQLCKTQGHKGLSSANSKAVEQLQTNIENPLSATDKDVRTSQKSFKTEGKFTRQTRGAINNSTLFQDKSGVQQLNM
jgi:hypothetical protein